MTRQIVLDTETTGLDPEGGHRLVEIGCVELVNYVPTGNFFHTYINPERYMPEDAFAIHGISTDFLANHLPFSGIVEGFLAFIQNDPLVIHNAAFDLKFLNAELSLMNYSIIERERAIDTLRLARERFPGSPASLDALCKRYNIDQSQRTKHGALVDAHLLAKVYLELIGGKQPTLDLRKGTGSQTIDHGTIDVIKDPRKTYPPRVFQPTGEEIALHQNLVERLKMPLWKKLMPGLF